MNFVPTLPQSIAVTCLAFATISNPVFATDTPPTPAEAPAHVVTLKSSELEVVLDRDRGLPHRYLLSNRAFIRGEDAGRDISATVCRRQPRSFDKITLRPQSAETTGTRDA